MDTTTTTIKSYLTKWDRQYIIWMIRDELVCSWLVCRKVTCHHQMNALYITNFSYRA